MAVKHVALDAKGMKRALELLDAELKADARLIIGGGAAMVLAYKHPLATQDIDAFAAKGGLRIVDLDQAAKKIAKKLNIEPDWLNSHFDTFTVVLPADYATRLRPVFAGQHLSVEALGPEDLLVMKCFAGRDKDLPHARKLLRVATDLSIVDRQLGLLVERRYPGAEKAADFFDDLRDREGV
jgi:hypothetical protein